MTPEKGTKEIRAIVREEGELTKDERVTKERNSTFAGRVIFCSAIFILVALTLAHIFSPDPPDTGVTLTLASLAVLLAYGGGALVQGVRLDKILTAWRKNGEKP